MLSKCATTGYCADMCSTHGQVLFKCSVVLFTSQVSKYTH